MTATKRQRRVLMYLRTSAWNPARIAAALQCSRTAVVNAINTLVAAGEVSIGKVRCLRCGRRFWSPNRYGRRICDRCHKRPP